MNVISLGGYTLSMHSWGGVTISIKTHPVARGFKNFFSPITRAVWRHNGRRLYLLTLGKRSRMWVQR